MIIRQVFTITIILWCWVLNSQSILTGTLSKSSLTLFNDTPINIQLPENAETIIKTAKDLLLKDLKLCGFSNYTDDQKVRFQIIAGNINDPMIKKIIIKNKINIQNIHAKWEHFLVKTFTSLNGKKLNGILIIGSDPRGTAYGLLEISKLLGVSPWYYWADVPIQKRDKIHIIANFVYEDGPKVKYRGIFINDEAPALSNWSKEKFGGFNHLFYEKVFELMLRLKANYIWPAMWGNAFYDDDSENKLMAEKYGIVIGTSHHEPLMRAHDEWRRHVKGAQWNYETHKNDLQTFWKEGMDRADNEKIVTVGMRGDGDEPMTEKTAISLLENIVADQRKIIESSTKKPANQTPQMWALYKEVQDYYDKGMQVPEDITLLFCDDNWGNVRRLPSKESPRSGGYGMYYHFDYVGGPRNYKWLNTNYLPRIWDQMTMSYQNGIDRIWIVNVGDIKPMELPVSFFLDLAWNPEKIKYENVNPYFKQWSAQQFGAEKASEIGEILHQSSHLISLRKPEILNSTTYSLDVNNEFENMVTTFKTLTEKSSVLMQNLDKDVHAAYFQLVHHPLEAMSNLYQMYYSQALNHRHFYAKSPLTNFYAGEVKKYYQNDSLITQKYHQLLNGKWNHMMSQTHIGYTYWQQPLKNVMPHTYRLWHWEMGDTLMMDKKYENKPKETAIDIRPFKVVKIQASIDWKLLDHYGRYGLGLTTWPMNHSSFSEPKDAPAVNVIFDNIHEYEAGYLHLFHSPTLDVFNNGGLKIAVSVNESEPEIISLNAKGADHPKWEKWVADNIIHTKIKTNNFKKGQNTITIYHMDPAIILQRIFYSEDDKMNSYLGAINFNH